ncbi:MAG: 50S ribosomal protein L21 [Flavobacteriales bacterium]|jgi:large subunit ribosomal protein L21|nr:50S ribosomal protein L21 [Flavobacteriales bacterium]MBT5341293.1 50S ribosomal protein L21 [Flavobacteriales bacterium]
MYVIVEIAGLQYKVQKDQRLYVNRLDAAEGKTLSFDKVLLAEDKDGKVNVGAPVISDASVGAVVEAHVKGDKVIIFKKKRRKGYTKKTGHRQMMTEIRITSVNLSAPKKAATKEVSEKAAPKAVAKKAAPKAAAKKAAPKAAAKKAAPKKAAVKKAAPKAAVKKAAPKAAAKTPAKKA